MPLLKTRANLESLVQAPWVQPARGCLCMTCGRLVDSEEIVEGYPGESGWAKVLVKHHGAEELRTFDMGSTNWDHYDLASMMARTNWFDPTSHEGVGLGHKNRNPGEHDDGEPTKVISLPSGGGVSQP